MFDLAKAQREHKNLYWCSFSGALILVALGIFDACNRLTINSFYEEFKDSDHAPKWRLIVRNILIPFVLISVSFFLSIGAWNLVIKINKYFSEYLLEESRRVKAIFIVFTICYVSRAVWYIIAQSCF